MEEKKAITAIMRKLGSLPLALDHAGSYIFKQQCTFSDYLQELEANISLHLNKGWKRGDDQESVSASWEMSFEVLQQRFPKAIDLLSICGFLDNEDISEEFLRRGMKIENNGECVFFVIIILNIIIVLRLLFFRHIFLFLFFFLLSVIYVITTEVDKNAYNIFR